MRLPPGVGVSGARLELIAHEGLVARDPGIVARLDHVGVAGGELELSAVVVPDDEASGPDHPDMAKLAAVGTGDRLHAVGPLPARLEGHARGGCVADPHDVDAGLLGRPRLVGRVEIQCVGAWHVYVSLVVEGFPDDSLASRGARARPRYV